MRAAIKNLAISANSISRHGAGAKRVHSRLREVMLNRETVQVVQYLELFVSKIFHNSQPDQTVRGQLTSTYCSFLEIPL